MNAKPRRLAIFDLDGTLVDSRQDLAAAGNAARGSLGLPPLPLAAVTAMIGDGASKLIERLTPDCAGAERELAMTAFRADYAQRLTATTSAYAGVPEMLAALRASGWAIACATNKPAVFAAPILDRLGLRIDALRGGEGPRKPDPEMIHSLMRELGAGHAATWMIGDHHTDLVAAANARVRSIWCAWGFGRREDAHADEVAARPGDVPGILDA